MTSVLLIAIGLSVFFAVLKLADSIRDIAFELREARRALDHHAARSQELQRECWEAVRVLAEQRGSQSSLEDMLGDVLDPDAAIDRAANER
jgi:hypothetical protein